MNYTLDKLIYNRKETGHLQKPPASCSDAAGPQSDGRANLGPDVSLYKYQIPSGREQSGALTSHKAKLQTSQDLFGPLRKAIANCQDSTTNLALSGTTPALANQSCHIYKSTFSQLGPFSLGKQI